MRFARTLAWMARKELMRFASDPTGAVSTLVVPVVLAVLLSTLFAPRTVLDPMPLLIASDEDGPRVEKLVANLDASPSLIVKRAGIDEARQGVLDGRAAAALVLPEGVENALQPISMFSGNTVPVELLFDPSRATEVEVLVGLITRRVMQQVSSELASSDERSRMFQQIGGLTAASPLVAPADKPRWTAFANAGIQLPPGDGPANTGMPLELQKVSLDVFNPYVEWNAHAHYFAGMLTMFLLFLSITSALNLINERETGALQRVLLSGASPYAVLLGGALGTTVIAMASAVLVYLTGTLVFGIHVGSPIGLVAMLLGISHLVGAFTLFLCAVGRTARQISAIAPLVILVMGFIGGSALPSFIMPEWVQSMAIAFPTTWANEGLAAATWRGADLATCLVWAAGVFGFSALFAAIGIVFFRWKG